MRLPTARFRGSGAALPRRSFGPIKLLSAVRTNDAKFASDWLFVNQLAHAAADATNALLAAAGYNFRLLISWLKLSSKLASRP
jgi:hypothetical protein